jgi:Tropinone reductase 1
VVSLLDPDRTASSHIVNPPHVRTDHPGRDGAIDSLRSGTVYAMSKAAINQLAKNLACEWAKDGIRVNSVAPWWVPSGWVSG